MLSAEGEGRRPTPIYKVVSFRTKAEPQQTQTTDGLGRGAQPHGPDPLMSSTMAHSPQLSGLANSLQLSGTATNSHQLSGTPAHSLQLSGAQPTHSIEWHTNQLTPTEWHTGQLTSTEWHTADSPTSGTTHSTEWHTGHSLQLSGTPAHSLD